MKEWYTQKEVHELEGISKKSVYKRVKNGYYSAEQLREVPGKGGRGGTRVEIHYSALSDEAQKRIAAIPGGTSTPVTASGDTPSCVTASGDTPSTNSAPDRCDPSATAPARALRERPRGGHHPIPSLPKGEGNSPSFGGGRGEVLTPDAVDMPKAGRLPDEAYWMTVQEAAKLMGKTPRHALRILKPGTQPENRAHKDRDGAWRIHAHILPDDAQRDFYLRHGRPVPDYLLRQMPAVTLDSVPRKQRDYIMAWHRLLNAFESFHLRQGTPLEESAERFCTVTPKVKGIKFSPSTLLKKRLILEKEGMMGLQIQKRGGGKKAECDPQAWDWLLSLYSKYNGNKTQAIEALEIHAQDQGWTIPSCWTLMKRLNDVPPGVVGYLKKGKKWFDDSVLPSNLRDYESFPAMHCWVGDHHVFDMFVVDDEDGSIKRPWVTAWQDMRSRKLVGLDFNFGPNSDTISISLYRGIKQYGIPQHVLIDNGKDYKSKKMRGGVNLKISRDDTQRLKGIYEHLGIISHFAIPYNAKSKPIERTFRTFEANVCTVLEGYVGNKPTARPERAADEMNAETLLSMTEFAQIATRWVEERYHLSKHRGHGMRGKSPNEIFEETVLNYGYASEEHLRLLLMKPSDQRTYGRNGFRLFNQFYLVEEGEYHAAMQGRKCYLRYDPQNLSDIYVYDEEDVYICKAVVVERSQLFEDEESMKKLQRYRKQVKKGQREALQNDLEFLDGISREARVGLSETPPEPAAKKKKAGVPHIVPNQTQAAKTGTGTVIEFTRPAEPDIDEDTRKLIDDKFRASIRRKQVNGPDVEAVDDELRKKMDAFFGY